MLLALILLKRDKMKLSKQLKCLSEFECVFVVVIIVFITLSISYLHSS